MSHNPEVVADRVMNHIRDWQTHMAPGGWLDLLDALQDRLHVEQLKALGTTVVDEEEQ